MSWNDDFISGQDDPMSIWYLDGSESRSDEQDTDYGGGLYGDSDDCGTETPGYNGFSAGYGTGNAINYRGTAAGIPAGEKPSGKENTGSGKDSKRRERVGLVLALVITIVAGAVGFLGAR